MNFDQAGLNDREERRTNGCEFFSELQIGFIPTKQNEATPRRRARACGLVSDGSARDTQHSRGEQKRPTRPMDNQTHLSS